MDDYVYVFGTGRSLLDLTRVERDYLHQHPRTLAINRYYMYYEKLGVLPKMLFLADFNYFADLILRSTIDKLNETGHRLPFYVNRSYLDFYRTPWYRQRVFKHRARRMMRRRYDYEPPGTLPDYSNLIGMPVANETPRFDWASDLQGPLYHRRGSLSTALNLVNILYPGCSVKLLGIDLSSPGYFYDEAITDANRDQWVDEKYKNSVQAGSHAAARPKNHDPVTLTDVTGWIQTEFRRQGLDIFNCNRESLLVTRNVTPYAPVIE